jgi:5-methylcytosine-specific restriction protein A
MPYAPPRPCNFAGCPKKQHAAYCELHRKQRSREYEQSRKGHQAAYANPQWQRARSAALKRDDYVCQRCLKEDDRVVPATQVHHIEKFNKDGWQTDPLFIDLSNLESICASHHSRIDGGWGRSRQGAKKQPLPGSTADWEARFGSK